MKYLIPMLVFACLFGLSSEIRADVVLTQKSSVVTMGMGTSEITTSQQIKGDMDHTRMVTKAGAIAGIPGGGTVQEMENIIINRIDKGIMWILTPQGKIYNEMKFEELKAMTAGVAKEVSTPDADNYEWTFDVDKPREETINGYKCRGLKGVANGVSKTDQSDKTRITYELWTSKDLPGGEELVDHYKKLSALTGQDKMLHADMARQMFRDVGPQFSILAEAVTELEGFPVKIVMALESSAAFPQGSDDDQAEMMKSMKSMMGGQVSEDGMLTMMSVTTELTAIEKTTVDPAVFEIPDGYVSGF